ncbi:50S ribosomal protein L3 [Thermoplasmatales archaeon SW_10_69_26]|jgi:large subunit ribosomal protein L3|nr:MAG: 50S ribosomal protein L3 [Thermoplasmatales archaeon SW_10_69_26]
MVDTHHPKRGSQAFSPRKRASEPLARFRSWPDDGPQATVQGFTGFKAGMTHVMLVDYRPTSTTSGQEVREAVTVLEVPPMGVAGVRAYRETPYGLKAENEVWAEDVDDELDERVHLSDKRVGTIDDFDRDRVDEVRLITYNKPYEVTALDRKVPDVTEMRVGGGEVDERLELASDLLGTDLDITDVADAGRMLDVAAVTKGKGLQGSVKRWGVKLQSHKNSKNRRDASPLGPFQPRFIRPQVPLPGQMGFHQRTELNKRLLMVGEDPEEINPDGGFVRYGEVSNPFALLHGTTPGPSTRPVSLRHALRYEEGVEVEKPNVTYISTASKQGR